MASPIWPVCRRPARSNGHSSCSDFQLGGGVTGAEVCRELASNVETAGIPVVLFSGMDEAELARTAESAGAAGYLPKPDNLDDFVKRLDGMTDRFTRFD
ncbi:MAG: response regulator [Planctomycetota bacterium]